VLGVGFALSYTLHATVAAGGCGCLLTVAITIGVLYIGHLEQVVQACGATGGLVITALTYDRARPRGGKWRASKHEITDAWPAYWWRSRPLGDMLAALVAKRARPDCRCHPSCFATHGTGIRTNLAATQWPGVLVVFRPGAAPAGERLRGCAADHRLAWVARGCHQT